MASEDEDDYLSMSFGGETASAQPKETSLQRTTRLKKEAAARARIPSKAERERQEKATREAALATHLDASNKGAKMLAKMGFRGGALGKTDDARTQPIEVSMKDDRGGVGMDSEKKRKIREAAEQLEGTEKRRKVGEAEFRERAREEREERRVEGMVGGAMRVLEGFDTGAVQRSDAGEAGDANGNADKAAEIVDVGSRPLRSVPLLWRSLIKQRLDRDRERRMRYDLDQSLSVRRDYDDDPDADADDKLALATEVQAEDLDEEDSELAEYEALPAAERLSKIVTELREKYRYCFWCKYRFPDTEMDGCPGLTEDEHG